MMMRQLHYQSTLTSFSSSPVLFFRSNQNQNQNRNQLYCSHPNSSELHRFSRQRRRFPSFSAAASPVLLVSKSWSSSSPSSSIKDKCSEEEEDYNEGGGEYVVVGNINKVHGIKGELSVIPTTDFPLLRFSNAGKRWVRSRVRGKEELSEVELVSGREHPSQKTWIIRLAGIEEVEQAKQFVGSALLVKEEERPFDLEEGEFYTPDLVGMSVLLQETGRLVGVVANVFNYGASDLLQVKLCSTDKDDSSPNTDIQSGSGQMVWVPFVEEIVPEVYLDKKEMYITPPKGLLELNLRNDVRSKKERRQMEWKERKKLQNNLIAAKKKLSELHQDHLLVGLRTGDRSQKTLLAKQIVSIKFKLFQHALLSIHPLNRFDLPDFFQSNSAMLQKNALNIASDCLSLEFQGNDTLKYELYNEGHRQLLDSKTAVVLVMNTKKGAQNNAKTISTPETKFSCIQELTHVFKEHLKVKEGISIPLTLICPADEMKSCQEYMLGRGYCGLDSENVWFLEEEKLPIVSKSSDPKILMNSLYEIIQEPIGSGGVFISLSSNGILDKLIEMGVQYVQVCSLGERYKAEVAGNPLFLGLVKSREADMGINLNMKQGGKIVEEELEEEFNIIFTMKHLNKICKSIDKLQFSAVEEQHAHVEMVEVEGKLVQKVHPVRDEPNSYRFHSSIYSVLCNCSLDSICTMCVLG